jgi:hypothetical protein
MWFSCAPQWSHWQLRRSVPGGPPGHDRDRNSRQRHSFWETKSADAPPLQGAEACSVTKDSPGDSLNSYALQRARTFLFSLRKDPGGELVDHLCAEKRQKWTHQGSERPQSGSLQTATGTVGRRRARHETAIARVPRGPCGAARGISASLNRPRSAVSLSGAGCTLLMMRWRRGADAGRRQDGHVRLPRSQRVRHA